MANTCTGAQFSSYLDGGLTAISNGDCVSIDFSQQIAGAVPVSYRVTCMPPASDNPCFPSSSIVNKADGTPTRLDALKEGDKIVSATAEGSLTTDTVSLLSISQPDDRDTFLTLSTEANRTLTVTGEHHLPVGAECCTHLRKAKDVVVGDTVWAVKDGKTVAATVTAISKTASKGHHSPVLTGGSFPVVDGVVTSFGNIHAVTMAKFGLKGLVEACKASGTCGTFRKLFLGDDRKYIA